MERFFVEPRHFFVKAVAVSLALHFLVVNLFTFTFRHSPSPKNPTFISLGSILSPYDFEMVGTQYKLENKWKMDATTLAQTLPSDTKQMLGMLVKSQKSQLPQLQNGGSKKTIKPVMDYSWFKQVNPESLQENSFNTSLPKREPLKLDTNDSH